MAGPASYVPSQFLRLCRPPETQLLPMPLHVTSPLLLRLRLSLLLLLLLWPPVPSPLLQPSLLPRLPVSLGCVFPSP